MTVELYRVPYYYQGKPGDWHGPYYQTIEIEPGKGVNSRQLAHDATIEILKAMDATASYLVGEPHYLGAFQHVPRTEKVNYGALQVKYDNSEGRG